MRLPSHSSRIVYVDKWYGSFQRIRTSQNMVLGLLRVSWQLSGTHAKSREIGLQIYTHMALTRRSTRVSVPDEPV